MSIFQAARENAYCRLLLTPVTVSPPFLLMTQTVGQRLNQRLILLQPIQFQFGLLKPRLSYRRSYRKSLERIVSPQGLITLCLNPYLQKSECFLTFMAPSCPSTQGGLFRGL